MKIVVEGFENDSEFDVPIEADNVDDILFGLAAVVCQVADSTNIKPQTLLMALAKAAADMWNQNDCDSCEGCEQREECEAESRSKMH